MRRRVTRVSEVISHPVSPRWSIYDFILIWLGGLVGTGVFLVIGEALGNQDWVIILALAGQYIGSLGVFWILTRRKRAADIGLTLTGRDCLYVPLGVVLQIGLLLLLLPLTTLLFPDGRPSQDIADIIAAADTLFLQVSLVGAAVVLGPLTEEIMYRGVLLKALEARGKRFALVTSSVVFALVHITGLDTDELWRSAIVILFPIFLLGLVLGWLTQKTGRLGPAIFLHSGWNLLSAFVLILPADVLEQMG